MLQNVVLNVRVGKCAPEEKEECFSLKMNLDLTCYRKKKIFFGEV